MLMNSYFLALPLNLFQEFKIVKLRQRLGYQGFGLYVELLLKLAQSENYKLPREYDVIAYETHLDERIVKQVVEDFNLFTLEDEFFFSEEVLERMQNLERRKQAAKKAGMISAESRAKRGNLANAKQNLANAKQNLAKKINKENKENKVNIKDKIKYKENVALFESEFLSLKEKYTEPIAKELIEILSNYKSSSGKTYKSDYHAILTWVVDKYNQQKFIKPNTNLSYFPTLENMKDKFKNATITL